MSSAAVAPGTITLSLSQSSVFALIADLTGQKYQLTLNKFFIKLCKGDHAAALLLSQILYWQSRTDDSDGWFYKSAKEWDEEICIKQDKLDRCVEFLQREVGLETKLKTIGSSSRLSKHYRLNTQFFLQRVMEFDAAQKAEQAQQKVSNEASQPQLLVLKPQQAVAAAPKPKKVVTPAAAPAPAPAPTPEPAVSTDKLVKNVQYYRRQLQALERGEKPTNESGKVYSPAGLLAEMVVELYDFPVSPEKFGDYARRMGVIAKTVGSYGKTFDLIRKQMAQPEIVEPFDWLQGCANKMQQKAASVVVQSAPTPPVVSAELASKLGQIQSRKAAQVKS